jgi:micrococcal nuclease
MYDYQCTIVRVVDGDTVDVDIDLGFDTWRRGERIRLYGVDTPECRSRSATEKKAGLLAKGFVMQMLHEGGTYKLTTKEKGKFGRYLGTIKIDGELTINAALISEHLAVPYSGQNKKEIEAAHKANYKVLKEKGLLC